MGKRRAEVEVEARAFLRRVQAIGGSSYRVPEDVFERLVQRCTDLTMRQIAEATFEPSKELHTHE